MFGIRNIGASALAALKLLALKHSIPSHRMIDTRRPKRRRTGYKHTQHCGARQQARYTRQLAAGQISFHIKIAS